MKQKKLKYSLNDPMVSLLCVLLLFLSAGCLFAGASQNKTEYRIGIDAAFGGSNKGFTGYIAEADINEKTVNAVEELLSKDDRFVIVRTHAAGMEAAVLDSAAKINEEQPEIVLSIHGGWDPDETLSGMRVYTNLPERAGEKEAKKFADEIIASFSAEDWSATGNYLYYHQQSDGTFTIEVTDAAGEQPAYTEGEVPVTWTLLENTEIPTVIVEQFFVSNKSDIGRWDNPEGYQLIAQKYYSALCRYLSIEEKTFEEETEENTETQP